jgi:mono/diheme cytochrome c family protein
MTPVFRPAPRRSIFSFSAGFLLALAHLSSADEGTVLRWQFDGAKEPGEWQGKAKPTEIKEAGPRAPRYPGFSNENRAALFPGQDAWILVKDHEKGGGTDIRFRHGDAITVEAWVKVKSIGKGQAAYLVGKGRHGKLGQDLGEMNQNYAVRLQGTGAGAQLGFLFTSEHPETRKRDWHRWWSQAEVPLSGWHHVAVTYTYGKADSLRAYIDGKETGGSWDMGGATDLPPVADADDLVIGTGQTRGAGTSFSGWVDDLTIHRRALAPEVLAARYVHTPPPPAVTPDMVPTGEVLVQISEKGVPEANSWPDDPEVTETYREPAFGFFESPQKYIATGVRADRANPHLFRAAASITLPKGKHRLLLRGRGAARLYIDGKLAVETPFRPGDTGGHGLVSAQDEYLDLGPDFRFVPPGNREKSAEFTSDGRAHFVVLETLVGGVSGKSKMRPELGETVAAISLEGEHSWSLLTPGGQRIPYTDAGWSAYEAGRREWLAEVNAESRKSKRAENAAYWAKRREAAQSWLSSALPVVVPPLPGGFAAHNEIDHFIADRISKVAADSTQAKSGSVNFFGEVQPILEARCYDCHQGGKAKGGLQLDRHAGALKGGKADGPAIVPGDVPGSSLIWRVKPDEAGDDIMPPKGDPLSAAEIATLTRWIEEGAVWPQFNVTDFNPTGLADDLTFLRRVSLDTVGVPPTEAEIEAFLADDPKIRRAAAIDRLLADARWADHWTGYWQDVLAENPNIINPTLNNTGPFRFWIHESLLDNKPADLFVTELVRMEGSERFGGPAGFGVASQNDVPMAEKGIIVGSAFLGVEMKCARCHDAPSHESKQEDLFQLAALLKEDSVEVPATSSVPMDRIHQSGRKPLIEVTLQPGAKVEPAWPFDRFCDEKTAVALAEDPKDPRDRLAALITAPQNERFAQVMANRVWQRLMGRGIVATLSDWEKGEPSHPELLAWLGRRLVASGYDVKSLARDILNSHAYQRAVDPAAKETSPLYIAPAPRRLGAEQIVDSLFSATGKPFKVEEVSLDLDSVRVLGTSITLGQPRRAWMLASTSNERDRPSLSLPRIQAVASVMETFGWRGARQDAVSLRDTESNVLQPAILANGTMGTWLTRLSDDHGITRLALEDQPLDRLIDRLYLQLLTRHPSAEEKERYTALLADGYESRVVPESARPAAAKGGPRVPERYVTWSNHLDGPANTLAQENEVKARRGDPPTEALTRDWRVRLEDVLWAMLNAPEWVYAP